jgi:putative heme transporter
VGVVIMVNAGMTASARTLGAHPVGQPMPEGQLEGHVLQPLVMGHPLAVVLGISVGGVIAGIVGALLAVPTIAFFNSAARVLLARDPVEKTQQETGEAPILEAEPDGVDEPLRSR